jgi:hypothetical protein
LLPTPIAGALDTSAFFEVTTAAPIRTHVVLQVAAGGVAKADEAAQDTGFTFVSAGTAFAGGPPVDIAYFGGPYEDILLTKDISADPRGTVGTATIQSVTEPFAMPEPAGVSIQGIGLNSDVRAPLAA